MITLGRRQFLATLAALLGSALVPPQPPAPPQRRLKMVTIQDDYIAGFQFYGGPAMLSYLSPGRPLVLRREPTNRYDENAVAVVAPAGPMLGYLPRQANRTIAVLLDQGATVRACVIERDSEAPPWHMVKVRLKLVGEAV